jgi:hypothetical protein
MRAPVVVAALSASLAVTRVGIPPDRSATAGLNDADLDERATKRVIPEVAALREAHETAREASSLR